MRVDLSTVDRERFDYARILIATSSLDIIKAAINVFDDITVNIKLVEVWGFSLGKDVCLFEEESVCDANDNGDEHGFQGRDNDERVVDLVDNLVNDISEDLLVEEWTSQHNEKVGVDHEDIEGVWNSIQVVEPLSESNILFDGIPKQNNEVLVVDKGAQGITIDLVDAIWSGGEGNLVRLKENGDGGKKQKPSIRTTSCPPSCERSMIAGPWSLEWLRDIDHEDVGVIFSSRKKLKKKAITSQGHNVKNKEVHLTKKKLDGVLRHPGGCLKKVARLPATDRKATLHELQHQVRKRGGGNLKAGSSETTSEVSLNNDWKNCIVLHGNEQVAVDYVWGIGNSIGLKFTGDKANMFNVLSHRGRKSVCGWGGSAGEGVGKKGEGVGEE